MVEARCSGGAMEVCLSLQLRSAPIWLRHGGSKTQGCSGFVVALDSRWSAMVTGAFAG